MGNDMSCERCEILTYIKDKDIDLFFLTKTWLSAHGNEGKTYELAPSGFRLMSFPRPSSHRGDDMATIYKSISEYNITLKKNFDFTHTMWKVIQASTNLHHNTTLFLCTALLSVLFLDLCFRDVH